MDRIPPELWEKIFLNLQDSSDFENAYNSCQIWNDYLDDSKSCWMFAQALPLLIPHLTKADIIQCRKICRHWRYGVDSLLENNPYHQPTCEIWPNSNYQSNFDPSAIANMLHEKNLVYCCSPDVTKKRAMLTDQISNSHQHCAIIGSAAIITESNVSPTSSQTNLEYLQIFGGYIQSLKICINDQTPLATLRRILHFLKLVPNLKQLEVHSNLVPPHIQRRVLEQSGSPNLEHFSRHLLLSWNKDFTAEELQKLPKLETLQLNISGVCDIDMKEILVDVLSSEKLTSFSVNTITRLPPNLNTNQIVNISLEVNFEDALCQLQQLRSPLKTINLKVKRHIPPDIVFETLTHFRETLSNVELNFAKEYFQPIQMTPVMLEDHLNPFWNSEVLVGFEKLKRFTLEGCYPLSLNFLCGLKCNLEYLKICLEGCTEWKNARHPIYERNDSTMELDLVDYLIRPGALSLYRANIWKIFRKLKVLTVKPICGDGKVIECRRDIYEKLHDFVTAKKS